MDEPTPGTAAIDRELLRGIVDGLRRDGLTTIIAGHDVAFISDVYGRLLAMNFGRTPAVGKPHGVLALQSVIDACAGLGSAGPDAVRRTEFPTASSRPAA